MTSQDFGPIQSLVNTLVLMLYDVDLESRTYGSLLAGDRDPVCTGVEKFFISSMREFASFSSFQKTLVNIRGIFHPLTDIDNQ